MFWRLIKSALVFAGLAAGAVLAINTIPSLKANILEVVNPRVKEARLIESLSDNLDTLEENLSRVAGAETATSTTSKNKKLVDDSQELLKEISDINQDRSGMISGIVDKVANALFGSSTQSSSSESTSNTSTVLPSTSPPTNTPVPCVTN